MSENKRSQLAMVVPVILLVVLVSTWYSYQNRSVVLVTIKNNGTTAMKAAELNYADGSSGLGDIQPGQTSQASFEPSGEKSVQITYTDESGEQRIEVPCDLVNKTRGSMEIALKDGKVENVKVDLN